MMMMTIRVKEYLLKPEPVVRGGLEAWHCWIHSYTLLVIALMMMILWIKKTCFEVYLIWQTSKHICAKVLIFRSVKFAASENVLS